MGKEKSNKAFIGIFLVIGAQGDIHVEVRTITTGNARAGFAYKSFGFGLLPYFVGPYATYRPSTFDTSITVDGEINATLACVPQVGVIIWGKELGVLQVWLGVKSKAIFNASGSGGNAVRRVAPYIQATADAYTNVIKGKIAFSPSALKNISYSGDAGIESSLEPYAGSPFLIEIYDKNLQLKLQTEQYTDAEGKFTYQVSGAYNLLPSDWLVINLKEESAPELIIDNSKFKVAGKSPSIYPTVPFNESRADADAFNDVISGWFSGNYTGPVTILIANDGTTETHTANAVNGVFKFDYPLDEGVSWIYPVIDFEGWEFPRNASSIHPNLDALTINLYNDFSEAPAASDSQEGIIAAPAISDKLQGMTKITAEKNAHLDSLTSQDIAGNKLIKPTLITGTITNKADMGWLENSGDNYVTGGNSSAGLRHFDGEVKITVIPVQNALEAMMEMTEVPHIEWSPKPGSGAPWTATTRTQQVMDLKPVKDSSAPGGIRLQQLPTSAARFEFEQPDAVAYKVEIIHEGLTLTKIYNPFEYHYNGGNGTPADFIGPFEKAVILVTEEKVDSVVNPADVLHQWNASWVTQMGIMQLTQKGNAVEGVIMQGSTALPVQGTVTNGVFRGSYLVPSDSLFGGDIVTFEMEISADGKSINFKSFGTNNRLKALEGTNANKYLGQ
ncbi:MAG TPA: hypothetical protein VN580_00030 [Clostridia bacterium]|nr:hypothetical protein [Clostridia bacterium]